ncbi:hypothetical protein C1I98_29720 [Spongiactinospora gelatinilytica]|uniref:Uncharacterized protein n=1 Tax=Spongiactinospora gelatinilytica TaxID=2666298 RepID=A0A2W2GYQ0_9ACTN|nr:hypothetical protein C1I98_29720 [Spongiactinospora gelatinilytica]
MAESARSRFRLSDSRFSYALMASSRLLYGLAVSTIRCPLIQCRAMLPTIVQSERAMARS